MLVSAKMSAPVLELNPHLLPAVAPAVHAALRGAVWVGDVNGLNEEPELEAHHPKQVNHSLFVDRDMPKATEAQR